MKKSTTFSIVIFTASIFAIAPSCAQKRERSSSSITVDISNGKRSGKMNFINDGISMRIEYDGKITFTEDEKAIQSIENDGYLRYRKENVKINAESDGKGGIIYEIYEDGEKIGLNERGKKLLAEAIADMIAQGIDAEGRVVERIYKKSGTGAVMKEVERLRSDYVKSLYFEYLLENAKLSTKELAQIAQKTGDLISSDYEKGKLLSKFSAEYLKNAETAQAYLDAVGSISSDFEKANALKTILKQPLNSEQFVQVMRVSNSIGSDFEKANILKTVLKNNQNLSAVQFSETLKTISTISSDFEKAGVLKSILGDNTLSATNFEETLSVIADISSDFERGNVLKYLMDKSVFSGEGFNKLLSLISDMGSDFEQANVLKRLIDKNLKDEDQWIGVINTTAKLGSDFEKSNVMVQIGRRMPKTEKIKATYLKVAKTISSDMEYGKVIRALE